MTDNDRDPRFEQQPTAHERGREQDLERHTAADRADQDQQQPDQTVQQDETATNATEQGGWQPVPPAAYEQPGWAQPNQPTWSQPDYGQPSAPYGASPHQSWPQTDFGTTQHTATQHPATYPATAVQTEPARRGRVRTTLIGTAIVAALNGGGVGAGTVAIADHHDSTSASGITMTTAQGKNTAAESGTVSAAAQRITPSVVTISVAVGQQGDIGSGMIIRSDGYILTNNHVVSAAADGGTITVQTSDGKTAKATIVGTDPTDDLAVIKVSGLSNLTAATFAKSSDVQVGQTVVAIGAPLGLSDTVTSGIVSATARAVRAGDNNEAVFAAIQTDAAINPGNSGGALVDLSGNVVGVNAAIATTSSGGVTVPGQTQQSGNIGIGFAIPSDEAARIASELITTGKATHAVLGVTVRSSTGTSAASTGAKLQSVQANGAAGKAGLKAGDVVTEVDGARIEDGDSLIAVIRAHSPGDSVKVTYTRDGQTHTATLKLTSASS